MFAQRIALLSNSDVAAIHTASMNVLATTGVTFDHEAALAVFRQHGVRVVGKTVFLSEEEVMSAVSAAPPAFTLHARNPEKNVTIGDGGLCFAPGLGAPFIIDENGRRQPTIEDYDNLIRLADALPNQDLSGRLLVQPVGLKPCLLPLYLTYSGMVNSEKPFMGSAIDELYAQHTMEMARILFAASPQQLAAEPVTISLISVTSPLQFNHEMAGTLLAYARWRQPVLIASLIMAGATGPITLAGSLAQQNAEVLAGIALAQLINPGTPVVYGSASTMMDMRSGMLAVGSPEFSMLASATAQLAHFYGLPCRAAGTVTDSHRPDMQAGFESMFGLLTAVAGGVDFVLHAAGLLSSFLAFSLEKFVLDDEICGMVRHFHNGIPVTEDTLAIDVITNVGSGGNYLEEDHTWKHCRTAFWQPALSRRDDWETWEVDGQPGINDAARCRWQTLLEEHHPAPPDTLTTRQLQAYMEQHGC